MLAPSPELPRAGNQILDVELGPSSKGGCLFGFGFGRCSPLTPQVHGLYSETTRLDLFWPSQEVLGETISVANRKFGPVHSIGSEPNQNTTPMNLVVDTLPAINVEPDRDTFPLRRTSSKPGHPAPFLREKTRALPALLSVRRALISGFAGTRAAPESDEAVDTNEV